MAKEDKVVQKSVGLPKSRIEEIEKISIQEKRSFSKMVDILLDIALPIFNKKKK
jgi:hypothetical protein